MWQSWYETRACWRASSMKIVSGSGSVPVCVPSPSSSLPRGSAFFFCLGACERTTPISKKELILLYLFFVLNCKRGLFQYTRRGGAQRTRLTGENCKHKTLRQQALAKTLGHGCAPIPSSPVRFFPAFPVLARRATPGRTLRNPKPKTLNPKP